ncbi:phytoene desaturase family protein [Actinophytocola algeriensis]|uniref:Pyridine nucleotide-disulfide oxidoreductase domain-containing protein 2 n=1 Tax=Actinophytocola algeriensis TaxID=1768010 RepID=A0A7W7Q9X8_9PSEU|nr:NAD(P)/FAD-dependent oxidoreductase [Actinophytocola algeriensis]MBB4909699.1 phytoene dehydrogenase-like protein [Actinophytocola algeriensis]MBE1475689.1 phytoene dehydrogenase-like protein [Actinophytocola algeriensis]
MEEFDAVVVGAGHNGLVAANMLADAGWRVLVCEATDAPGGAVASAELTAPGYISDLCSAFYPLAATSPALLRLGLEEHGLRWRHAPSVLAHVFPDGRNVVLSRDLEETAKAVGEFAAADADAWHAEFAYWQRIRDDVLDAILSPFPPVRAGARLARRLGPAEMLRFARRAVMPVRTMTRERFAGDGARALFAGSAMHTDLGPDQAGSGIFGWLLTMLGQEVGFPVPEGGAGQITAALVRRLSTRDARVDCGRPVTSLVVGNGEVLGVWDAEGQVVRARRAVLADVPAPVLYRDLVGESHLPARLVADLDSFHWDDATIKVDWALSGPVPWSAPAVRGAGTVHMGADLDGLAGVANDLACGRVPRDPFLLLGQMTTADPSRSPAGTESVWAYTHVPRGERWSPSRLKRRADRIEQVIEDQAPGFRSLIAGRAIAGPAELAEHNPSLVEGAINAGTSAIHQQLVFRPVPGLGRADTVIDRLFLAGASAHPGGGVHGAAGANAAKAALARDKVPGYHGLVSAAHKMLYR